MSFSRLSARRWFAPSCALAVVACSSATPKIEIRTDGRLRVIPQEFTSEVGCSFASGEGREMGHYVATLVDLGRSPDAETEGVLTDDTKYPQQAGSGVAARCTSTTTFSTAASEQGFIEVGHMYAAIVDGYRGDRTPDVAGERDSENWSAPHWQWLCGVGGLDETQLDWLVERAALLTRVEFEADAGVAPTSNAPSTSFGDAAATSTSLGDATATSASFRDAAATALSMDTPAIDAGSDADVAVGTEASALDAATSAGDGNSTGLGNSFELDAANSSDENSTLVDSANSTEPATTQGAISSLSLTTEFPPTDAATPTTADAGLPDPKPVPRDWRAELSQAAKGDFAPPPMVVSGGQSGVRGCVPLF